MRSKIGMAMSIDMSPCGPRSGSRGMAARRGPEMTAILRRRDAEHATKRTVHRLRAAEAARGGDFGDGPRRRLEQAARRLHALCFDVDGRRHADLAAKRPREIAWAHVRTARQRRNGELAVG